MDDEFLDAINATADTSFDASRITCPVVLSLLAKPRFFPRRSGIATTDFLYGERPLCGFDFMPAKCPPYLGPPSARILTDEDKRGAWQLQEEYLADRLGKNKEENGRLWKTVIWIDKHYRVVRTPAEALPPLNIYVGDKNSQSTEGTGAPAGPDDEAPDEAGNEGVEFESINVCQTEGGSGRTRQPALYRQSARSVQVMDEDGTTHRLEIKADGYAVLSLVDDLNECGKLAKIDVNEIKRNAPPLLPQTYFPSDGQRAESGKIIRMLMMGMRTLWPPVIQAITDHVTMASLAPGKSKDVAAAVGRQRVIEGLRVAESIKKGLKRQGRRRIVSKDHSFSIWLHQIRARQTTVSRPGFSVDDTIKGTLAVLAESLPTPVRAPPWALLNLPAAPVVKIADMPLPANDNHQSDSADRKAA
jgi:hypothetical protein